MTYRRDLLDIRVVVRQSARPDQRPELPARLTPLAQTARPMRESDAPSVSVPADTSGTGATPEVILVKSGFKQVAVRVREILYVEAARNYVRIHRGRLVNMERIRSVRPLAGGRLQLTLTQGSTIIVARDRRRAVLAELSAVAERRA
jgi:DNA-binding LytR/AlgR family response regulator